MPPPDESTSLLPEAGPLNWRQKCGKFFDWFRWCGYILLLLAQVVWLIFTVGTLLGNVKAVKRYMCANEADFEHRHQQRFAYQA